MGVQGCMLQAFTVFSKVRGLLPGSQATGILEGYRRKPACSQTPVFIWMLRQYGFKSAGSVREKGISPNSGG